VAVFTPILLMGGLVGRLFREFAMTLSVAIAISLLVSLTTTPMMCATLLARETDGEHGRLYRASERAFEWMRRCYERSLSWVLRHPRGMLAMTLLTVAAERLPVLGDTERILSPAGHRAPAGAPSRRPRTSRFQAMQAS